VYGRYWLDNGAFLYSLRSLIEWSDNGDFEVPYPILVVLGNYRKHKVTNSILRQQPFALWQENVNVQNII
jgi:hypothetical protein